MKGNATNSSKLFTTIRMQIDLESISQPTVDSLPRLVRSSRRPAASHHRLAPSAARQRRQPAWADRSDRHVDASHRSGRALQTPQSTARSPQNRTRRSSRWYDLHWPIITGQTLRRRIASAQSGAALFVRVRSQRAQVAPSESRLARGQVLRLVGQARQRTRTLDGDQDVSGHVRERCATKEREKVRTSVSDHGASARERSQFEFEHNANTLNIFLFFIQSFFFHFTFHKSYSQ